MSVVLITGAATGIGNLTADALAEAGHVVYASMREVEGRNAERAERLVSAGRDRGVDLRIVELDVLSQDSAHAAVDTVLAGAGQLDIVVHNAGHLSLGYLEAFTVEEIAQQFDVNAFSVQRVNRAVLPHMRERGEGTLVYVGSTTTVSVPPFLGPYPSDSRRGDRTGARALARQAAIPNGRGLHPIQRRRSQRSRRRLRARLHPAHGLQRTARGQAERRQLGRDRRQYPAR
jgi:NAD(P)-dependent dehydrogenase (short-subunit alcohol dehydrogenase family)